MIKTKLARQISLTLAGSALLLGVASSASAHVMYNTYNADGSIGGTDGWSNAGDWVGTSGWCATCGVGGTPGGGSTPFGSVGLVTNWAAQLHAAGAALEVSTADALADYGITADIDTAKGAWNDKGPTGPTNPNLSSQGWGHHTDVGLFKSDVTQNITLTAGSLHADSGGWSNFGISVFTGMDTGTGYDHHGGWNISYRPTSNYSPNTAPATLSNPLGTAGLTFLTYTDNSTVTFTAQAGQVYSILLGGFAGAGNFGPVDGYVMNITSSPVPLPAATWLFAGALASLAGVTRRKRIYS